MPRVEQALDLPALSAAVPFLKKGDRFILTSHVNSDGDGLGGCLALQGILAKMGKSARVLLPDPPSEQYRFLSGWNTARQAPKPARQKARYLIVLDCPTLERIGHVREYIDGDTQILNIDHHRDSQLFGHVNLVTCEVSSSSELVYHLAQKLGVPIAPAVAAQLYLGMLFDTGGFRYSLTTPVTLEVAADLVRCGAQLDVIADHLFGHKSLAAVKLLGKAIDSIELRRKGQIAVLHVGYEDMQAGDVEEIASLGLLITGVEVAITLKEEQPHKYRISLRYRARLDVSQVAATFGGGGHIRASGCRLEGDRETVKKALLKEIEKSLRALK